MFFKKTKVEQPPFVDIHCSSVADCDDADKTLETAAKINKLFEELHKMPHFPNRSIIIGGTIFHLPAPKAKK